MKEIERVERPGAEAFSPAQAIGNCLKETMLKDKDFYFFSPDETTSNRLDAVYETTARAWAMPMYEWDMPESVKGRIVELLSENTLFATMVGHTLSGGRAMMTSYESFFSIITSQILQHLKFLQQAEEVGWRPSYPAINLLSTSMCWRQDHNGFSHQSPALISTLLARPGRANCFFPCDDVAAGVVYNYMIHSNDAVNLMTFDKNPEPRWIDSAHAKFQIENGGASVFGFASDDFDGEKFSREADLVFTAAGDVATREALLAMRILRRDLPDIRMRFIGVSALSCDTIGTFDNPLDVNVAARYFGRKAPVIANFHGYVNDFRDILRNYVESGRVRAHGFMERGSTTTPFEMLRVNRASRYDLCVSGALALGRVELVEKYERKMRNNATFALENGVDRIKLLG